MNILNLFLSFNRFGFNLLPKAQTDINIKDEVGDLLNLCNKSFGEKVNINSKVDLYLESLYQQVTKRGIYTSDGALISAIPADLSIDLSWLETQKLLVKPWSRGDEIFNDSLRQWAYFQYCLESKKYLSLKLWITWKYFQYKFICQEKAQ
jgi:hypothetical protein